MLHLSLAQVDKCIHVHRCKCTHRYIHRDKGSLQSQKHAATLFSQQQSSKNKLESHWLMCEKCSWMELQRQIIQMVFCFSASSRCSCFSGRISKTALYSATWKEMTKLRRKINRKRKSNLKKENDYRLKKSEKKSEKIKLSLQFEKTSEWLTDASLHTLK